MVPGFLVGALALQIRGDLDVSVAAVASGVTVFFAAGALGAGPGGRLAERVGALRAMRGCLLVTAACLVAAAALAQSLLVLLALLAVAGVSNAITQPAINLFMADEVPLERQGLAFGIKQSAIPAAVLASGLALPLVALPFGWRPTFVGFAAVALVIAGIVGRSARTFAASQPRPPAPRPTRALVVTAVGAALASAGPNSLGAYLVASAVDIGIAEGVAGVLAAAGSGVSLITRVIFGQRADRRHDYGFAAVIGLLVTGSLGLRAAGQRQRRSLRGGHDRRVRARVGLARAVQPRRGRPEPPCARRGHRSHANGHLPGRRRGPRPLRAALHGARLFGLMGHLGRAVSAGGGRLRLCAAPAGIGTPKTATGPDAVVRARHKAEAGSGEPK